jgi:Mg-chelatase subunit ChlD
MSKQDKKTENESNSEDKRIPKRIKIYNYQKLITYHPPSNLTSSSEDRAEKNLNENNFLNSENEIRPPDLNQFPNANNGSHKKNDGSDLLKRFLPEILRAIGNKAIKDSPPSLHELESYLQEYIIDLYKSKSNPVENDSQTNRNSPKSKKTIKDTIKNFTPKGIESNQNSSISLGPEGQRFNIDFRNAVRDQNNLPIVTELMSKGYLVDSERWLNKKGFLKMGEQILAEIIRSLKKDKHGMHETRHSGYGSVIQESSSRYEHGNEISNINISSTIRNFTERFYDSKGGSKKGLQAKLEFPLDISYEDIEVYDTLEEARVSTVYCIDLSSTMKYASMYSELNRIEASKRALWSLYILNKKFFPMDIIHTIGFGSIATKIDSIDIPFLKTFEPNADFLHYTNYQSAYRLAEKILKKDVVKNKRIVMITDGHPSACFLDNSNEKEKILKQRPYSHFYNPNKNIIGSQNKNNRVKFDINDRQTVYLCYRYRQIDQYIGDHTIREAQKLRKDGIEIDTIMVSEEDTLLDFVNELAKSVNGKSIYINPGEIDKILITDYLSNKKKAIGKH